MVRYISKKGKIQRELIDQRIVAIVKLYCEQIDFDPSLLGADSTRSGYGSSCSERGVPIRNATGIEVSAVRRCIEKRRHV